MKLLLVQFEPIPKNIKSNQIKVDLLLSKAETLPQNSLVVLPEMALTGYCFHSPQDILPYCEDIILGSFFVGLFHRNGTRAWEYASGLGAIPGSQVPLLPSIRIPQNSRQYHVQLTRIPIPHWKCLAYLQQDAPL